MVEEIRPRCGRASLGSWPSWRSIRFPRLGLYTSSPRTTHRRFRLRRATGSSVLTRTGPFETAAAYYTAWAEEYLALIADGQLYPQFPVEAYLVYRLLQENAAQLAGSEDEFFLKHVDDKGDHLLVDQDLNITGVIDWQMARVVPRHEAFALSLVSADMNALCGGDVSLSKEDVALGSALREKGSGLARYTGDEKVRRFFWGLGLEPEWAYALPLANAILRIFGVEEGWDEWKKGALKRYEGDERLRALVAEHFVLEKGS